MKKLELLEKEILNICLNLLKQLDDNYPTYYFSKTQRSISYTDIPAEDAQELDSITLSATLQTLITQELQKSKTLFLYYCPDNALLQFEDCDPANEDLDIFYEEPLTANPDYKLYLGID